MIKDSKTLKSLFLKLTNKNVKSIIQYNDGFTNLVYLINDAYVLKMPNAYVQPFIDYKNEKYILELLKDNKNVVNCFLYNLDENVLIMKAVHQGHLYTTIDKSQIALVAKVLKKLHKINDEKINKFNMFERLKIYKSNARDFIDGRYERKIINRTKKAIQKEQLCLCHNDLVRNNLLFKYNDLVLLDFEFAGLNFPYFDLASFISENNLSKENQELFLKYYFGYKLSKSKIRKVETFIKFEDILWYYWSDMMYHKTNQQTFLQIKQEKYARIKSDIESK